MNVFVEEDEEAVIDCSAWLGVKISGNAKVRGNASCIIGVEVTTH